MKYLLIILVFFSLTAKAQYPKGMPYPYSVGFGEYGYFKVDSAVIYGTRDTSWTPRFNGTVVRWQNAGVDTTFWVYEGKWKKLIPVIGDFIKNQYVSQQDASSWYKKIRTDTAIFNYGTFAELSASSTTKQITAATSNIQPFNNTAQVISSYNVTTMSGGAFTQTSTKEAYGIVGALSFRQTGNQTLLGKRNSAIYALLALGANNSTVTDSMISALVATANFTDTGNYQNVSGLYVAPAITSPTIGTPSVNYVGSITNYYGLNIDTPDSLVRTKIANSYALYQKGITDSIRLESGRIKTKNIPLGTATHALGMDVNGVWVKSVSIGSVTSVATNTGSGITGGTITSTGTIAADTINVLSTKYRAKFLIDSLNSSLGIILSKTDTLNFPIIAANATAILTSIITGAVLGNVVTLGIPVAATATGLIYGTAWVSAAGVVSIQAYNSTAAPIDPASGIFKINVFK